MDKREAKRFLSKLYGAGDAFEVLYLNNEGQVARKAHTLTGPEIEEEFIEEAERAEGAGFNVYVSVIPTNKQGDTYDRIWVDQDDPEGCWPFAANEIVWPKPTTLVKTSDAVGGYRWQAIWLLKEPIPAKEAKRAMKYLAKQIGADEGVHDARRVLRLPGVMNVKRASQARLLDSGDSIEYAAFGIPEADTTAGVLTTLMNADVQNPNHVLGEWLDGVNEGDRNRKAYMAARHLKNAAVQYNDAAAIMKLGAQRCEPPLDDRELEAALDSAYHRSEA